MSRRKQSHPKPVKRDDLPLQMDEESVNGEKSIISTEEGNSSRSASTSAEEMWQESQGLKKEDDLDVEEGIQGDSSTYPNDPPLNCKACDKSSASSSNDPMESDNGPSEAALVPPHPSLLSADLLQSLQYFALLRQSFPNSSLIHLPGIPKTSTSQVSPPLLPPSKSSALNHPCPSCGICFSSVSTLSAHVTYYCSKRPKSRNENAASESCNGRALTPEISLEAVGEDSIDHGPSAPKIRRSGRYYACPYCSFSADKRVSLNRHMRVHVGLPLLATNPVSPPLDAQASGVGSEDIRKISEPPVVAKSPLSQPITTNVLEGHPAKHGAAAVESAASSSIGGPEKYCAECKIQFSSLKTYQVHKEHYCQFRKSSLTLTDPDESQTLQDGGASKRNSSESVSNHSSSMSIFVLPTHPPIVVPLCILQSARMLTADQPMPSHSVIVSSHGEIQFRADTPEAMTEVPKPDENNAPNRLQKARSSPKNNEEALDLSSKPSESVSDAVDNDARTNKTNSAPTGNIRIREELAHVPPSPESGTAALPFLPPKVFAELEALGSCLGVPSGHEMASNPAQWLAMLENAVLQASSSALPHVTAGILSRNLANHKHNSSIPCEECNITFRRMESYLVHKQHYCAARHQLKEGRSTPPSTSDGGKSSADDGGTSREVKIKLTCNQCAVDFESVSTLQAHRSFYCPKRDASSTSSGTDLVSKSNHTSPDGLSKENKGILENTAQSPSAVPSTPVPRNTSQSSGSPIASGSASVQGWKCPCCETVSPTAAAAQKHVETHSNVRAFRCSFCGYRGNTLRGMRTHVRIHFDRRNADLCEDNYITCILSNELGANSNSVGAASTSMDTEQIFKSLGLAPEVCAKVLTNVTDGSSPMLSPKSRELGTASLAGLQFLQLAQRLANHSPGPSTGAGCRSDKLFLCDLCCYSSSYRGNVIRHSKLVHGREISDVAVVSSNFLQQQSPKLSGTPNIDVSRSKIAESPPRIAATGSAACEKVLKAAPRMSPSHDAIQVKIDPDDVMISQSMSPRSQSSPNLSDRMRSELDGENNLDSIPKHCKSCNITFTYMSTFLAHKKYYCSSQTVNAPALSLESTHT